MKNKITYLLIILILTTGNLYAEDVTTIEATNNDISENLDLEAVASLFGESKDLEDFEKRLNDPDTQISNLDLNEDGEVDYLRVIETSKNNTHLVTIQAVVGKDQYQDVATIDVEKDNKGETKVQVVGDVYMYGPGYIIEPVYVHPPVIFVFFWGPLYSPWRSPYYWGYYPPYYRPWRPYPTYRYRRNVNVHINVNNSYSHTTVRSSKTSIELQKESRRNDFATKNPDKSFDSRRNRNDTKIKASENNNDKTTGKKVQKDWKPASEKKVTKPDALGKTSTPTKKSDAKNKNKIKSEKRNRGNYSKQPARQPNSKPKRMKNRR